MTKLKIYEYPHPVLKQKSECVAKIDDELRRFLDDMLETMYVADGVGLAAPQVGLSKRLFVVDGTELGEDYPECADFKQAFINPEIIEESEDTSTYSEGCLSLPGISENVVRPVSLRIKYLDEDWNEREEEFTGFCARIIQHEYDHLEAHVFTDRISPIRKTFVRNKLTAIAKGKVGAKYKYRRN